MQISALPLKQLNTPASQSNARTILFACSEPSSSPIFKLLNRIYRDAFAQQGLGFEMTFVPDQRAYAEISQGNFDGHCGRRISNLKPNTSLLSSSVTIVMADLVAASMSQPPVTSFKDLTNKSLRVGMVKGSEASNVAIANDVLFINIVKVDRGIRMLAGDRLDYVVSNTLQIERSIRAIESRKAFVLSTLKHNQPVATVLHSSQSSVLQALDISLQVILSCTNLGPVTLGSLAPWLERVESDIPLTTCNTPDHQEPAISQELRSLN